MLLFTLILSARADRASDSTRVAQLMDSAFFYRTTDLNRTIEFLDIALEAAEKSGLASEEAGAHNRLGLSYNLLGRYGKAMFHLDKARSYFRKEGDEIGLAMVTSNIALVHYNLEELDRSLELNLEALRLREKHDVKGGIATNLNNIANIYTIREDYDQALQYYQRAYELFIELESLPDAAVARKNMVAILSDRGEIELAKLYLEEARELIMQTNTVIYIPFIYMSSAKLEFDLGNLDRALESADIAVEAARENNQLHQLIDALHLKHLLLNEQGEYQRALEAHREFKSISDTVFSIEKLNAIAQIENAAILEQKDLELQRRKESAQLQRQINVYIIAALVFALALLLNVFVTSRRFAKTNVILERQKEELQEKTHRLEAIDQDKNRLFGVISQDLRGPIANLGGLLELLSQEDLSQEEFTELSKKLHTHFGHLSSSLDNLLAWASIQMKGNTSQKVIFDLSEACDEVVELLQNAAKNKAITLQNTIPANAEVRADVEQVKVVLRNLISNALKFTPPEGVVTIAAVKGFGNTLQISVSDNGVGIPKDVQERMMKSGESISTFGTKGERGTGLGLSLCRDFVGANEVKFWFESRVGHGSTFYFTLPSRKQEATSEKAKSTPEFTNT